MRLVRLDGRDQPGALFLGEVLRAGAEDGLDSVERIALAPSVPERVVLDTSTDLLDSGGTELDDVGCAECGVSTGLCTRSPSERT